MARWFESFQSPATVEPTGSGGAPASSVGGTSPLSVLRSSAARIGTTLDEDTTCAELTQEVAGQVGAAVAVLRVRGEAGSKYEAVSGNPAVLPDARWAEAVARKAAGLGESGTVQAASGGPQPALCVPLAVNQHRYGVLVCAREGAPFTRAEADLVTFLAERAASSIRHAREHDAVSGIVGKLQRALLAEPGRPHPNLDVAIRYLPVGQRALVGGDWCETVRLHFGRTLLVVGDVMGHGLEAAVDMAAYRSSLRYIASADLPPHRVLRQLDDIASKEPDRRPATCLIARVDPVRGLVTLASAGHLPPAVIDGQGRASLLPVPVGPPLGTGLGGYEPATYPLNPSQALMLFTDGLVERRGEDIDQSLHRLAGLSFSAAVGVEDVLDTVLARLDATDAEDDVAVLAARLQRRSAHAHDMQRSTTRR
ncbi:PP2C family protein-serine/threonine phosphatase [Streptomyces sp. PSKA30]|uniref:PP2C family protein-serine/threonine phosphatase n=1 Tax=Streptomyces sp. PSKA30 TaxID=2874597 RepID=UPI001CD0A263|nr:GAF domain-containing SpoIIE family protein phosphatase [Streptomyces sp. PSKA30]MBZ9644335.1 SpoIIE family protein phosphatase [Streptomyces sp. PSKA30]